MSAQPTHEPTPRRLTEARRGGLVAQSHDLRTAVALAATFAVLVALGPSIVGQLADALGAALARAPAGGHLDAATAAAFDSGVRVLVVPLAVAFGLTLIAGWMQTGGLWIGPPRADLGRLSPGAAWRRFWGGGAFAVSVQGLVKVAVLALVAVATLGPLLPRLVGLAGAPAPRVLAGFGGVARRLGFRLVTAALLIGVADAMLARRRHRRALRMTRREIDRERRELEGDPIQRAERRRQYAEDDFKMGTLGGFPNPPALGSDGEAVSAQSDLVVTADADSVAVALAYERGGDRAPIVVARGRRTEAARIAARARAAGVPVFSDAALAQALCDLDAGAEIPEATYDDVAELVRATRSLTHGASGRRA
jgi:type III secretion protein U